MTKAPCLLVLTATIAVLGGAWNWKLCPWKPPYWPDTTETTQPSTTQSPTTQTPTTQPPTTQPPTTQSVTETPRQLSEVIDYCTVATCPSPRQHTRCRFPSPTQTGTACGSIGPAMTSAEVTEVLNRHNVLRAQVASGAETRGSPGPQPPSSNLGPMTWNDELATIAQTWANQCIWGHDDCKNTHTQRVGQNIAASWASNDWTARLTDMVNGWYEEVQFFNSGEVPNFTDNSPAGVTGHYSQLVWAKSTLLGCGVMRYNHPQNTGGNFRTYLVCNYAEAGNFLNNPVYERR